MKHNNSMKIKQENHNNQFTETIIIYKRLWGYMAAYWKRFLISIVAMIIAAITEPLFAKIMQPLIDNGFIHQDQNAILLTPILVIIIFLIRAIASYINETNSSWLSGTMVENMRSMMFTRLLKLPISYFDKHNSGRIISRIIFDVTQITEAGFNIITITVRDGCTIIGLFALLLYIDWQLTLFCLVTLPFVLILIRILAHRLRSLTKINQHQYGEMTQLVTEVVHGQKIIKLFLGYDYEINKFNKNVATIKDNNVKQTATSSLNSGLSQFLVACALAMILYFAAHKSQSNHFTAGDFVSFITAMIMIFAPMKRITNVTQSLQRGLSAAGSVFEFLDHEEEINNGTINFNGNFKQINFTDAVFSYPNTIKNAVNGINLTIHKGQTIALVGSSGSGKTSLVNLIPRFYELNNGSINIDDININQFELNSLRAQIAFVNQDTVLFNDTIYNNILYGANNKQHITMDHIIQAASLANAIEFIDMLPDKFETIIGENGTRLSGGQKQRIAIARAILNNAPILILDEATSSLDTKSEKLVQQALDYLMQDRTTIVIAHRLTTIINADMILVMKDGNIIESGTHTQLLANNFAYSALYNH